jgi:zinc/manganese transport system substrate-binding protein
MGDVHPLGNPHYHYSPANIIRVAEGMANALAALDRANSDFYKANYKSFAARFNEKQKQWKALNLKGKKYVAYHKLFGYLANDHGFQIIDYMEPKPGIPPSAAHIEMMIEEMKSNKPSGILVTSSHGLKDAESLGAKTGVKVIILPQDVGAMPGTDDWFAFMDKVLAAFR